MQTVIQSVDRTPERHVIVNTSVDLLHCPIRIEKDALRQLGYTIWRPAALRPLVVAAVEREARRRGRVPLGGFEVTTDDLEGLPPQTVGGGSEGPSA